MDARITIFPNADRWPALNGSRIAALSFWTPDTSMWSSPYQKQIATIAHQNKSEFDLTERVLRRHE
jgi:hypothetical protein